MDLKAGMFIKVENDSRGDRVYFVANEKSLFPLVDLNGSVNGVNHFKISLNETPYEVVPSEVKDGKIVFVRAKWTPKVGEKYKHPNSNEVFTRIDDCYVNWEKACFTKANFFPCIDSFGSIRFSHVIGSFIKVD
jgi:hypothetical protein